MAVQDFTGGLGSFLFPDMAGVDPAQAVAARNQGMLMLGLGMLAGAQKPGASLGSSLFEGFRGAQSSYGGAMQQAFQNTLVKNQQEQQQKNAERAEKTAARLEAQAAREEQQGNAVTASRVSTGIGGATDKMGYWNLVKNTPEVKSALAAYNIDPAAITTPEQLDQLATQFGAAGQVGGPVRQPTPLQLVKVKDPKSGKVVWMPEQQAVGMQSPSSGGIVIGPDGTVQIGGEDGVVGPGDLSKPTVNALQESIIKSTDRLDRLNSTLATYKPEYLQARGVATANLTRIKDKLGLATDPAEREFLSKYTEFRANAAQDTNVIIKEMAGSAVTPQEAERQLKVNPSDEDSPIQFDAKAKAATRFTTRAIMRANWALKNGIGVKSVDDLAKAMPLTGIDAVYEQRANEIWQALGGTPETKAQAIQAANQEFGLAR